MGKPWYAAPELVLGDVKHQNSTTDIYAIGILFFQLFMKQRPFEGANHEVLDMQLHKRMPLKMIPRKDIRNVIERATNKKQELRYQSAAEFRVDVDKLPPNPDPTPDLIKWIIGGIGATAIVGTIIFLLLKPSSEPEPNPNKTISYAKAVNMLHDTQTASEGIKALQALASSGNYDAAYLLSKLYFDPKYQKRNGTTFPTLFSS